MEKNLKLFASFSIIVLTFASPTVVRGMQDTSRADEQKPLSGMQLAKGAGDTLEAPLGTGSNALLKISMDLKDLRRCTEHERVDVPVRLFLTDFTSAPTNHPPFNFQVKVDCELTPLKCVLPDKLTSFDSHAQFTQWLEQGYFTNQVSITYDFQVDVQKSAPSLAQHLFFLPPNGYRFIGTHLIDNPKIIPDSCEPKISYISERGDINATTVTLGGILYLHKKSYSIEDHKQVFPHRMIEEKILKIDKTKKFYHHQWVALSEVIAKFSYEEFPNNKLSHWLSPPSEIYTIVRQEPRNKHQIEHLFCTSGSTGGNIDIKTSNTVFKVVCGEINGEGININEAIVKDSKKILYHMKYRNLTIEEVSKSLNIERTIENYYSAKKIHAEKNAIFYQYVFSAEARLKEHYCKYKSENTNIRASKSSGIFDASCCSPKLLEAKTVIVETVDAEKEEIACKEKLLNCMEEFNKRVGCSHPRSIEFSELRHLPQKNSIIN